MKKGILKALGLKKWSISCDRVMEFLKKHNKKLEEVNFAVSTDFEYATRCGRIGKIVTYGSGQYKYNTHIYYYA